MANAGDWNQNYSKFKDERKEIDTEAQITKNKGYGVSQNGIKNGETNQTED